MARHNRPSKQVSKPAQSVQQVQTIQATQTTFTGKMPHPELLKQYDVVVSGAAGRILAMAENEAKHRQSHESQALVANIEAQKKQLNIVEQQTKATFRSDAIGQFCGFVVSLICIAGAIYLALNGQLWVAGLLAGLPLAAIIRAFREYPRVLQKNEGKN